MQIYLPYRFLFYQDYPWILDANREKKFASAKKVRFREKKFASAKKCSLPRKKVRFRELWKNLWFFEKGGGRGIKSPALSGYDLILRCPPLLCAASRSHQKCFDLIQEQGAIFLQFGLSNA